MASTEDGLPPAPGDIDLVSFKTRLCARLPLLFAIAILLATSISHAVAEMRALRGTRVTLLVHEGFSVADNFTGIVHKDAGISIVISELPTPARDMQRAMSREALAERGMVLHASEAIDARITDSALLKLSQNSRGTEYEKWILIGGSAEETVMLTATVPASNARNYEHLIKQALATASWDPERRVDPLLGLGFSVSETDELKIARRMGNAGLILTRNGDTRRVPVDDPLVVVVRAQPTGAIEDLSAFARKRLAQTRSVSSIRVRDGSDLELASMPAYELTADATGQDGQPVTTYQMIAHDGRDYYVIQAFVGRSAEVEYLEQFKAIARSFKLHSHGNRSD
jgi:hypothetical protein